ncbi:hypothetical protein BY996DRAFT_6431409 [Phakopsora pachyrhizi]|uniref:Expressed protein n=1 Tax=Phakopsora pachyrhizi TaxID=170000 RepID=A0AAV0BIV4_PHAPC|nr:hypothetical protein BY996DRAFT_6431409 [Phakopsora pachyrhizi]CAH7685485.1 expressed protein [Phakopsora pachyrhizi]
MAGYRVEYASSGRSKCNGKGACKGTMIGKGELRVGTWVMIHEHGSFKWRHWTCCTPEVLRNIMIALEDKSEELDGYDELRAEDKQKVKFALENLDEEEERRKKEKEANRKTKGDEAATGEKKPKRVSKKRKIKSLEPENENLNDQAEEKTKDNR